MQAAHISLKIVHNGVTLWCSGWTELKKYLSESQRFLFFFQIKSFSSRLEVMRGKKSLNQWVRMSLIVQFGSVCDDASTSPTVLLPWYFQDSFNYIFFAFNVERLYRINQWLMLVYTRQNANRLAKLRWQKRATNKIETVKNAHSAAVLCILVIFIITVSGFSARSRAFLAIEYAFDYIAHAFIAREQQNKSL